MKSKKKTISKQELIILYFRSKGVFIMKEFITVFTAQKARQLLKEGFTITDIKADKTDIDHKRSIFIFKNEEGLLDRLKNEP